MLGLAVLTALNIADEFFRARDQQLDQADTADRPRRGARADRRSGAGTSWHGESTSKIFAAVSPFAFVSFAGSASALTRAAGAPKIQFVPALLVMVFGGLSEPMF